jgi:hypothetical protein
MAISKMLFRGNRWSLPNSNLKGISMLNASMVLQRDAECHYFNVLSKEVEMKDSYKYAELSGLSPSLLLYC